MGLNPMMGLSNFPNFGLGPNDNMNMFNSMLNIFNNNSFNNPLILFGRFPGPRTPAPSPFIFQDNITNNINNNMNLINNMNNINNNNNNQILSEINYDKENNEIKRDENFNVQKNLNDLLTSLNKIEEKNKDIQYIINYIPFTVIKDVCKEKENQPKCLICLSNYEVGEKVSALPCFHCFHTKCIDDWIIRKRLCPICKFELTLKSIIGEDIIKQYMEKREEEEENMVEEESMEEEFELGERQEQERIENERRERERQEQERTENERRERQEQERLENERRERERQEQERIENERRERERQEQERIEKEKRERQEQERIENEKRERQEQERLEKEKREREKLDKVRKQTGIMGKVHIQKERIRKAKEILEKQQLEYDE